MFQDRATNSKGVFRHDEQGFECANEMFTYC